jgi:hypothetical protein
MAFGMRVCAFAEVYAYFKGIGIPSYCAETHGIIVDKLYICNGNNAGVLRVALPFLLKRLAAMVVINNALVGERNGRMRNFRGGTQEGTLTWVPHLSTEGTAKY